VRHYLLVFAVTAGVTFMATPLVRRLSLHLGWIDRPSDRKVHPKPTPTAGGLAIYLGIVVGLAVARFVPFLKELYATSSELDAAAIGATMIVIVGVIDDTRGVSALGKLTGQILVAAVLVLLGVQLLWFYFPGQGVLSLSQDLAVPLTIAWLVLMMNAVNLIDGLDGLAAGIVAIAAAAFFAYMVRSPGGELDASTAALLSSIAVGAALGFLPWNFHPARVFMGDSGSLLLGLVLGVATVSGVGRNVQGPSGGDLAVVAIPILVPLLVLAVPLVDVALAIARRLRRGTGIGHADKEHIHHRLLEIGHSHRQAVLLMYAWSALVSACALAVAFIDGRPQVLVFLFVAAVIAVSLPMVFRGASRRLDARRGAHRGSSASTRAVDEAPDPLEAVASAASSNGRSRRHAH
jgi:UDP-GlcNAc:undecaprenyl-phosphate/decaprenyl-phosphate GlcNAc-1-phosphate transferase